MSWAEDNDIYGEPDDNFIILKYSRIKQETKNAWLVEFGEGLDADEAWLPKSQCSLLTDNEIEVPEWLILENELEDYEA
jgi:hypothetical protein